MPRTAILAAIVLPVAGLAGLWGWSDHLSRQGTEWDVAIQGYDPRDLLRGHYVEFSYDWPESPGEESEEDEEGIVFEPAPQLLCLYGSAPKLERAVRIEEAQVEACAHPVRANLASVYGFSSLERGRFYLGQDRAREIDQEMLDPNQVGIVRIRQRDDGTITPFDIRFRPLTEAERAERAAEAEAEVDDIAPVPAIMTEDQAPEE
ncbi:GDYXXLXY domain-containing protein [Erythrobacter sp. JK5]|uniref:GDYXXLXY domain-containing protein n=1 Tax=Erythrobacter sp. JK5 TaxID=2829500 RepID=UPI001BAC7293|nr:GDYXXLXY domain-containing protein [Erythrobacter sp. JK5]QUL37072.1 GDYXXLXY domain-containing protein [Erythrobacter sp. JK5]